MDGVLPAWGRILTGYLPLLSIEITRECPLRCPGCYAYGADHLGGAVMLRQLSDYKGQALVDGVFDLVERYRPLHVSIVGGEPLVRYRELNTILPELSRRRVHAQVVTSAVREIPLEWTRLDRVTVVVSVDGLQPEHDERRAPATYKRILEHIAGRSIHVHCTITGQQARRAGYVAEFVRFWSARPEVEEIVVSLYTPQRGEISAERVRAEDREQVLRELGALGRDHPKLRVPARMIRAYADPPRSPGECLFALATVSVSADLQTTITPCQFGGTPDCGRCGCAASAGLNAIGRYRLLGLVPVSALFTGSRRIGQWVRARREAPRGDSPPRGQ